CPRETPSRLTTTTCRTGQTAGERVAALRGPGIQRRTKPRVKQRSGLAIIRVCSLISRRTARERGTQRDRARQASGAQVWFPGPGHFQALAGQLTSSAGRERDLGQLKGHTRPACATSALTLQRLRVAGRFP